ncbi:hypothetical protein DOTSEDRAFT_39614 [Dothistroma septosporum NZE10]|uniref:MYND-type domain-containing protein n=1 Tax=Dothistroma septosporum (strain NZE10 / CBS 128990) TaxID=675120 RepID=M2WHJ7_DOTSN|nr:hypothetical protein DOTSEDRAFT_39614 [Dothistroma septosporum NZE10]
MRAFLDLISDHNNSINIGHHIASASKHVLREDNITSDLTTSNKVPVLIISANGNRQRQQRSVRHHSPRRLRRHRQVGSGSIPCLQVPRAPLRANGVASELNAASKSNEHTFINAFFLDYDPYGNIFSTMLRAPYVGDQVILVRCHGLLLDAFFVSAMHDHITALTCDGKECGSKSACTCPKDGKRNKEAVKSACTKKVFSALLERTKATMALIPGAEAVINPLAEIVSKEGALSFCGGCGMAEKENGSGLIRCSKCRIAFYCGKKCQKGEWEGHKKECKNTKA